MLLATAVLGTMALSSCSTNDTGTGTVATANGQTLTRSQLNGFTSNATNGDEARKAIGQWLQVAAVGGDLTEAASLADLQEAGRLAATDLATPFLPTAGETYAKGLDGSPVVCLGAIPLATTTDPQEVVDAMTGGMSLADAATKYSADETQKASGGIVTDTNGATCINTPLNATVTEAMTAQGAVPGKPVVLDLNNGKTVVLIRPFDDLTQREQVSIVQNDVAKEFASLLQKASVTVDPRYGRWDAGSGAVVPMVQG
jgi:hypothetical protein